MDVMSPRWRTRITCPKIAQTRRGTKRGDGGDQGREGGVREGQVEEWVEICYINADTDLILFFPPFVALSWPMHIFVRQSLSSSPSSQIHLSLLSLLSPPHYLSKYCYASYEFGDKLPDPEEGPAACRRVVLCDDTPKNLLIAKFFSSSTSCADCSEVRFDSGG